MRPQKDLLRRKIRNAWHDMKRRCYNPASGRYHRYGARGIVVCAEWLHDLEAFYGWSLVNGCEPGLTIDRIDNDKSYSPDNCQWATTAEQAYTRSLTRRVTFRGEDLSLPEWAARSGLSIENLWRRVFREGWDFERAITTPVQHKESADA